MIRGHREALTEEECKLAVQECMAVEKILYKRDKTNDNHSIYDADYLKHLPLSPTVPDLVANKLAEVIDPMILGNPFRDSLALMMPKLTIVITSSTMGTYTASGVALRLMTIAEQQTRIRLALARCSYRRAVWNF